MENINVKKRCIIEFTSYSNLYSYYSNGLFGTLEMRINDVSGMVVIISDMHA